MRWLPILWMIFVKGKADSQIWEILNEKDTYHCNYLEMINFASQLDEIHIRVKEEHLNDAKDYLKAFRVPYKIKDEEEEEVKEDESVDSDEDMMHRSRKRRDIEVVHAIPSIPCEPDYCPEPKVYDWMSYDEITAFVLTINESFVNRVFTKSLGLTAEGRHIWQVRIRRGPCDEDKNFYMVGGSQAREWISPSVAVNFIWRLIYECLLAPGYSFYIIPLLNPDGYEYSRNNDSNWIKNRASTNNENCTGVNIDRNFSYKWGESGSSLLECSDVYNGGSAFSEVESQALQKGCSECTVITMLISFSASYKVGGESILYPWSYTQLEVPGNIDLLQHYAQVFQDAAYLMHGMSYTVKQASNSASPRSGTIIDWVMGVQNASSAFTVRLRGDGSYNHDDPSIILPTVEESWLGFAALIKEITEEVE